MQKKNYIVESMYAKYTDSADVQKKKLNESAQDMWVLVPTQNRYDDPIDVMKFAKKYGVFDSMSKAFDKAEELAPDRWDAFVPVKLSKSLTEARNPENDEINAALRKWANDGNLTAKEKALIKDRGITLPNRRSRGYKSSILGKNRAIVNNAKDWVKNAHPDTDFANALEKPRLGDGDVERYVGSPSKWWYDRYSYASKVASRNPDGSRMSDNQFKSLQPYADEKRSISFSNNDIEREKRDLDWVNRDIEREKDKMAIAQANIKRREKDKNRVQNRIDDINNKKKSIVDQAKAKHTDKKKNESLSLNESSGTEYEIYFSDLTPEAQADLLEFVGISSPKELNWDVYPIAMLFDYSDELEEI